MKGLLALLVLFSTQARADQVIYSEKERIGFTEGGHPPVKGWYTLDKKGRPKMLIAVDNTDLKLVKSPNGRSTLVKRNRLVVQSGDTPFPGANPNMTASTCTKVDLSPGLGPVRDQTAGTCYAYTATDLIDYGQPKRHSALYLASRMPKGKTEKNEDSAPVLSQVGGFNGNNVMEAIKKGMDQGMCPEELLPSSQGLESDYVKLLEYYREVNKKRRGIDEACDEELKAHETEPPEKKMMVILTKGTEKRRLWDTGALSAELKRLYPQVEPERVQQIYDLTSTPDEFVKEMAQEACKDKLSKNIPPGKSAKDVKGFYIKHNEKDESFFYEDHRQTLMTKINEALEKGKPAGISYITGGLIQPPKPKDHAFHASIIAGRNWLPEEKDAMGKVTRSAGCYYQVKNSWGKDWKVQEGLKAKSSASNPGYFIVSEKQLMEHVYGITTID